jgi:hypothetical protein
MEFPDDGRLACDVPTLKDDPENRSPIRPNFPNLGRQPIAGTWTSLPLFKTAKFFGVIVSNSRSSHLQTVEESVTAVILGLQEKLVLPLSVDVEQIVRKSKWEIGKLIISLHKSALSLRRVSEASIQELSDGLLSLGLVPADGEVWFSGGRVVSLADERLRNNEKYSKGSCHWSKPCVRWWIATDKHS